MLLWTIQHRDAYEILLKTGVLRADEKYLLFEGDFTRPYNWLSQQMIKHIGNPPTGVKYPIWAWYQWEGERKRVDMRKHRYWTKKGTPIVLLTVDIPDDMVVLSDFDMWHFVLNNLYLPLSIEDEIENPGTSEIIESWEKIFQVDIKNEYWDAAKSTQATFWELKKEWVLKVEHFISAEIRY